MLLSPSSKHSVHVRELKDKRLEGEDAASDRLVPAKAKETRRHDECNRCMVQCRAPKAEISLHDGACPAVVDTSLRNTKGQNGEHRGAMFLPFSIA